MNINRRTNRLGPLACRVVVIMAVLVTCRTAMAQDSSATENITPILNKSLGKSGAVPFTVLNFGRNALLRGQPDTASGVSQSATPQPGPTPQPAPTQTAVVKEPGAVQFGVRGGVALDPELIM